MFQTLLWLSKGYSSIHFCSFHHYPRISFLFILLTHCLSLPKTTHTHTHNHTQTVSKPSLFVAATAHNNRADHVSQSGTTNVRASKVLYLEWGLVFMASDVLTMRCIILRTQMRFSFTILNLPLWTQKIVVDRKCRFFASLTV